MVTSTVSQFERKSTREKKMEIQFGIVTGYQFIIFKQILLLDWKDTIVWVACAC